MKVVAAFIRLLSLISSVCYKLKHPFFRRLPVLVRPDLTSYPQCNSSLLFTRDLALVHLWRSRRRGCGRSGVSARRHRLRISPAGRQHVSSREITRARRRRFCRLASRLAARSALISPLLGACQDIGLRAGSTVSRGSGKPANASTKKWRNSPKSSYYGWFFNTVHTDQSILDQSGMIRTAPLSISCFCKSAFSSFKFNVHFRAFCLS